MRYARRTLTHANASSSFDTREWGIFVFARHRAPRETVSMQPSAVQCDRRRVALRACGWCVCARARARCLPVSIHPSIHPTAVIRVPRFTTRVSRLCYVFALPSRAVAVGHRHRCTTRASSCVTRSFRSRGRRVPTP